jgi:hypothetical protein
MMTRPVVALMAFASMAPQHAIADWEAALHGGPTFPFYQQSFSFDPGPIAGAPGVVVTQEGLYRLDGRGGISFGASLAYHPLPAVGLELRVDTADVDVRTGGSSYRVRIPVPPFGTVDSTFGFSEGEGDLERLRPISLNLRLRSPGSFRVTASGGVSYLPAFRFAIHSRSPPAFPAAGPRSRWRRSWFPRKRCPSRKATGGGA